MSISSAQRARLRDQLATIMKQINAGDFKPAGVAITQLVRKHPALAETNHVASGYFSCVKQHDRAIYYAQRALAIDPSNATYHVALAVLLMQSGEHQSAISHLENAIKLDPSVRQAKGALGVCYAQSAQLFKARELFDQAIAQSPDDHESAMNLALLESDIGNAHKAVAIMKKVIDKFPDNPILHDSLCMFASYDDELSPQEVFAIHQRFGRCIEPRVRVPKAYPNTPDPERIIRIGFVSPDFKEHSIAYFVEPLFEHLDRTRFELFIYSTGSTSDHVSRRFEALADTWRSCTQGIAQTHRHIVQDQIDVLVELTGHFASNLLPIFAAKPSPVAITTIGYANTTGLETIDARLVDQTTDPSPEADSLATEQLVRIPGCFLCYRPPENAPDPQELSPNDPFTFGSFNDLRKISPSTIAVWSKVLTANPGSRLMLKSSRFDDQQACQEFLERFKVHDINPQRISLLGRTQSLNDHLKAYNQIDCALDTFPYAGTTTTCEALTMGVPVITFKDQAHAGRVGASLLHAIERDDLIAQTHQAYIARAVQIVQSGKCSTQSRRSLRQHLQASALCDESAYTASFEAAIDSLWKKWCSTQTKPKGASK